MAINYDRMRATTTRLLTENGMAYDVLRKGSVRVVAGKEIREPDKTFSAVGVRTDYKSGEIDGTVILSGDVRIVFIAETELLTGDMVNIDGKPHRVMKPNPVKPATVLICYRAQLRA